MNDIPNSTRFNSISGLHGSTIVKIKGPKGPGDVKFITIEDLDNNLDKYLEDGYYMQIYDFDECVYYDRGIVDVNRTDEPVEMKLIQGDIEGRKFEFMMTPDTLIRVMDNETNPDDFLDNPYRAVLLAQVNRAKKADKIHKYLLSGFKNKSVCNIPCTDFTITTVPEKYYGYDIVLDAYQEEFFSIGSTCGLYVLV